MKKNINEKSNRRSFFAIAGLGVFATAVIKAVPFSGFISRKNSPDKIENAKVTIHPKAVKRNMRGLS